MKYLLLYVGFWYPEFILPMTISAQFRLKRESYLITVHEPLYYEIAKMSLT